MSETEVLNLFKSLSHNQGFYGRLLRELKHIKEKDLNAYKDYMNQFKDCKEPLDVINLVEC